MTHATIDTPLGLLRAVFTDGGALRTLSFADEEASAPPRAEGLPAVERLRAQLGAYFRGERQAFDVPLALQGSPFQHAVWEALMDVPYGATVRYGELAARLGEPGAAQAVGRACGANPVAVVIPCHRVVGRSDGLTGYAGGAARKAALLRREGALLV